MRTIKKISALLLAVLLLAALGMSAAACFYQSVVGFCLVMITNSMVRRISSENAMF